MNSPSNSRAGGHGLARATSCVLVLSAVFALLATAQALYGGLVERREMAEVATRSSLPIFFYLTWATAALGFAGTVVTTAVGGFRPRWLWWSLLLAAGSWLLLLPIGTLLGFFTLVMLVLVRKGFPSDGALDRPV